ncbi:hypothetical protein [Wolbachia endosymbiont (group A) of Pherbina coryleti]|uniref:hypothetical protein n=1 Tax=Wolbachia endosymbiont (group A) of Pherbina coryleti TaxID=3066153 RepID=UPI003132D19C
MIEKLQINEFEGSGRGPGYGVFEDTESPNKEITPPDYDIITEMPNLSQKNIDVDITDNIIPLVLVGAFVLCAIIAGWVHLRSKNSEKDIEDSKEVNKKVNPFLENVDVASQLMKHQSSR